MNNEHLLTEKQSTELEPYASMTKSNVNYILRKNLGTTFQEPSKAQRYADYDQEVEDQINEEYRVMSPTKMRHNNKNSDINHNSLNKEK